MAEPVKGRTSSPDEWDLMCGGTQDEADAAWERKQGRTLSPTHREALLRTAALAGWAARPRDPQVLTTEQADAISEAAANAVLDRLAEWGDLTAPARTPS